MPPTSQAQTKTPPERPPDTLTYVKITDVVPSPDNTRPRKGDRASIETLAASIRSQGVLQALIVRPHPKDANKFDLRAGYRRWRAAGMAGLKTVPVVVRDMSDAEAIEITVTENLNREDLHPIDEGCAIAKLLAVGLSADDVAEKLGRSAGWVLRRAQLQHLHKRFVELNGRDGHPFADVPVGVLLQLARLPQFVQKGMAVEISKAAKWLPIWARSVGDCEDHIVHQVLMDLTRTIWKLDDAALYPKAASCLTCPKRSACAPQLFDDLSQNGKADEPGKCLDRDCFDEKHRRAIKGKIAKAKATNPRLVLITQSYGQTPTDEAAYFGQSVLQSYAVTKVKKGAKGAVAAVLLNGKGAGTTTYVRSPMKSAGKVGRPTAATMTLKQKRAALDQRRLAWRIDRVAAVVEERLEVLTRDKRPKFLTEGLLCDHLADLAVAFLMPEPDDMPPGGNAAWARAGGYRKGPAGVKEYELVMVTAVLQCWANRLQRHGASDLGRYEPDMKNVASYLDVDLSGMVRQAAKELPEPKGWTAIKKTNQRRK